MNMNIKRVPLDEIMAVIKRLESEGRINDAELFRMAVYGGRCGRIRESEKLCDHTGKIG